MNRAVALAAVRAVQETKRGTAERRVIALGGARELVPLLAKELREGGDAGAISETFRSDAAALVWIGRPDEQALRTASLARIPIVGVTEGERLPYVLDTNLVELSPGRGLPTAEIAEAIAGVLGATGPGLAARLPVLRSAVVDELISATARRNALVGISAWIPSVDLPILTLNQLRLIFGIAISGGRAVDAGLLPEVLGAATAAYGWRRVARTLEGLPIPAVVIRSGVAFTGTLAVGAAVRRRLA
jgi:hypothetical protein